MAKVPAWLVKVENKYRKAKATAKAYKAFYQKSQLAQDVRAYGRQVGNNVMQMQGSQSSALVGKPRRVSLDMPRIL